jgi:2-polyprenyl-3-methyl-5-hydroxy-6-metoxy-1,4-benzoquinol methylase
MPTPPTSTLPFAPVSVPATVLGSWPLHELVRVPACPACSSPQRHLLHGGVTDRSYRCAPGSWDVFMCETCSSAYLDPRPTTATAPLAYVSYWDSRPSSSPPSSLVRRMRVALRNGYLNSRYGYSLRPSSALGPFLMPVLPHRRRMADELVRQLHHVPGGGRLLDVGAGDGSFVAMMRRSGWQAEGVEPSRDGVRIAAASGVELHPGVFPDDLQLAPASLDAMTFRLVLEHLPDPVTALTAARQALRPGGTLWIATPSIEARAHQRFGRDWILLEAPRHRVIFAPAALTHLLRRLGFEAVTVRSSPLAQWSFRLSAAIARDLPPFQNPPPLTRRLTLHARAADLEAHIRPARADIVVLTARAA